MWTLPHPSCSLSAPPRILVFCSWFSLLSFYCHWYCHSNFDSLISIISLDTFLHDIQSHLRMYYPVFLVSGYQGWLFKLWSDSVKKIMLFDFGCLTILTISVDLLLPHIFQISSKVGNPYSSSTSTEGVYVLFMEGILEWTFLVSPNLTCSSLGKKKCILWLEKSLESWHPQKAAKCKVVRKLLICDPSSVT